MVKRDCQQRCLGESLLIKITTVSDLISTSYFVSNSKINDTHLFEKIEVFFSYKRLLKNFNDNSQVGENFNMSQN